MSSTHGLQLNNQTVASWSTNFSNFFADLTTTKMRMPEVQQVYDTTPRSTSKVEGSVQLAATTAKIDSLLSLVTADLDSFVEQVTKNNYFSTSTKSLSTLYRYFAHAKNGSIVVENNAETTREMQNSNINTTDARFTTWYSNAVAGPKHIFVVIDTRISSDVKEIDRNFFLKRIIKAALSIVQVTSPFDTLHMRTITEPGMLSGPILSCHGNGNLLENPDAVISYLIGNYFLNISHLPVCAFYF